MDTGKKKRGRPPKHKAMEFEGMTDFVNNT